MVIRLALLLALATAAVASAQAPETFTATAVEGDELGARSLPIAVVIDRYMTDAEHAAVVAALQEGPSELHRFLATLPDIGAIVAGDKKTSLKYIYRRPQSSSRIALLANEPLAFLDPGTDAHKPKSGFDFALVTLDFSLPGFGSGLINPAVKIAINPNGQIETGEYGAAVVRLMDVRKK